MRRWGTLQREGFDSHDHLLTAQQRVADELAGAQSNGAVVVRHGCGCGDGVSVVVTEKRLAALGVVLQIRGGQKGLATAKSDGRAKIPTVRVA